MSVFVNSALPREKSHLIIGLVLLGLLLWGWQSSETPAVSTQVAPPPMPPRGIEPSAVVDYAPPRVVAAEQPQPVTRPASRKSKPKMRIVRNTQRDSLVANLQQGFRAYQQGNYAASRTAYARARQQDANNRDALLGLAANNMRQAPDNAAYLQQAKDLYTALVELDPSDAAARAGLAAVDTQFFREMSVAGLQAEIQQRPAVAPLHYSLANQYAVQRRWGLAQAAYFKAFALAPDNADYAFNLAVSLDRVGQARAALVYYQRASDLAAQHPHGIALSALQQRMHYLQGAE